MDENEDELAVVGQVAGGLVGAQHMFFGEGVEAAFLEEIGQGVHAADELAAALGAMGQIEGSQDIAGFELQEMEVFDMRFQKRDVIFDQTIDG